jgi:hypothetical protein
LGRRPIKTSGALKFGSLMHQALEVWWTTASVEKVDNFFNGLTERDEYEIAKAYALIIGYIKTYADDHELYDVLSVESEFRAPLINPDTMGKSQTWELAGKIDVIVREKSTGKVIIIEHKTTSDSVAPESDYWLRLTIDGQISGYFVGVDILASTGAVPSEANSCLYDVIKKPALRPALATPEAERKYKKDGSLYTNHRTEDEAPEEYFSRVLADIEARPEFYFARRETVRMADDLADYMYDMWQTGKTIREAQNANRWPRNVNACNRYGTCEYFGVCCKCASINDDTQFVTVDNVNQELSTGKEVAV